MAQTHTKINLKTMTITLSDVQAHLNLGGAATATPFSRLQANLEAL